MQKRALRRPFLCRQLFEQLQQLSALGSAKARSDAALVHPDPLLEAVDQGASGAREPQAVRASILASASFHQVARFERVQHADHGRTIDADGLREAALRDAGVGVDQQQDPGAPRRSFRDLAGEVAEYRLLRDAQPIAEQPGQQPRLEGSLGSQGWRS